MRDAPDTPEFDDQYRDEQLRHFFGDAVIGAVVIGRDDTFQRVNSSFCKMLGYDEDGLIGKSPLVFTHPEDIALTTDAIESINKNGHDSFQIEKRFLTNDDKVVWVQVSAAAVRSTDDELLYYVSQIEDITERKRVESALQESEARLARTLAGSRDGLWEWNIQTGEEYISPRWMEIVGYQPSELEQSRDTFLSLLHPDDLNLVNTSVKAQIDEGTPYDVELRLRHKNGHYVWVKSRAKVFRDPTGTPLYLAGSITDLTNDKRKEAETEEFEFRYRTLFEMAKDGIVVHVGDNPVILDCNKTFAQRLGYERHELIGQPLSIFAGVLSDDHRARRREKVTTETHPTFESIHRRKDGSSFPVEITSSIIRLNNRPAVLSIVRDNSERKAFETALLASEQRFKDFAETTADRLWETDAEFRYTFATDLPAEAGRLDGKEMIGKRIWEFPSIDPTDENWVQHRAIVAARLPIQNFEYCVERRGGGKVWIRTNGQPVYDDDNNFQGYRGTNLDVTAEIESRLAAKSAEEIFVNSMNMLDAGFILWDADDRFVASNQYTDMFRKEIANALQPGVHIREFIRRLYRSQEVALSGASEEEWIARYMKEHEQPNSEKEVQMVDGSWQNIQKRKLPDGSTISFQYNITEVKKRQEQAESADRAKSLFLASASHDLRQPLQALSLNIYRLKMMESDPDRREIITKVQSTLDMLDGLLNSLLDLSKLESGQLQPEITDIPISEIFRHLGDEFESIVAINSNQLHIVPSELTIRTDPVLLKTVLQNLIANANKFTSRGRILIGCRRRGANMRIEVWDTGRGISAENADRIFEEFYQIDNQARDSSQGLGLGLSIVQRVARMLGHTLDVKSELGKGSVFSIELPRGDPLLPADILADQDQQNSVDALIVAIDDNVSILEPLAMVLEDAGYAVQTCAYTGPNCPEFMNLEEACGRAPDLIISDLRLPGDLNGIDVIDELRRRFGTVVPAMLISGDNSHDTVIQARESELRLLHKPVPVPKLCSVITEMLE